MILTKECSKCYKTLSFESFDKHPQGKLGLRGQCKECDKVIMRTKEGVIKRIYLTQKDSSKKRRHSKPSYTEEDLKAWCLSQSKFHILYKLWEDSGFDSYLKPSCDRIKNSKPYTLNNLQLGTWQDNRDRNKKEIYQYNKIGNFIAKYTSAAEAGKLLSINSRSISRCANKGCKTYKGFIWLYEKDIN